MQCVGCVQCFVRDSRHESQRHVFHDRPVARRRVRHVHVHARTLDSLTSHWSDPYHWRRDRNYARADSTGELILSPSASKGVGDARVVLQDSQSGLHFRDDLYRRRVSLHQPPEVLLDFPNFDSIANRPRPSRIQSSGGEIRRFVPRIQSAHLVLTLNRESQADPVADPSHLSRIERYRVQYGPFDSAGNDVICQECLTRA